MSRTALAVACILAAAVAFGAGYRIGGSGEPRPPRSVPGAEQVVLDGDAAEVAETLRILDPLDRAAALAPLLRRLGPESLEAVRAAYATIAFDLGDPDLALFVHWWARFDPEAAFEFTREEWRADHPVVVVAALRSWAEQDPAAALERAKREQLMQLRAPYLHAVVAGWDDSGEPGAVEYVRGMPQGHDRQRAIRALVRRRVVRDGVEAAFRWAEDFPDDEDWFKLNLFRRVAQEAALADPEAAAAWAEKHMDEPYGKGLAVRVGMSWVRRDPRAAMAWLGSLPAGEQRDDGVLETYRFWQRQDMAGATAWAANAPPERWQEPAVRLYAMSLAARDPERALEVAMRLKDEELRNSSVIAVARAWLIQDPEAAKAWIDASDLPEMVRFKASTIPEGHRAAQRLQQRGARQRRPIQLGPDGPIVEQQPAAPPQGEPDPGPPAD